MPASGGIEWEGRSSKDYFNYEPPYNPYFSGVPNNHVFFIFIQKMRQLRISKRNAARHGHGFGYVQPV